MTALAVSLPDAPLGGRTTAVGVTVPQPAPTLEDDDFALIRSVAARDRRAFETLYHRYAPRVHRYLSKFVRRPETVEEVFDDVMLVVWESASRFNYTSRLSTWILGIAHHKALKALGRSSRNPVELSATADDAVEPEGPEEALTHREIGGAVVRALDGLPPEQRAVVELAFYHERSYREIAEITGSPVNTVKTRMFHARRRLAPIVVALGLGRDPRTRKEPQ
jgi:RNA polymerase sigma-70 factor (ECF subfamily)